MNSLGIKLRFGRGRGDPLDKRGAKPKICRREGTQPCLTLAIIDALYSRVRSPWAWACRLLEARAATEDDPKKARPQEGDRFVFFSGDRKGEVIKLEDLPLGGPQIVAYPMDPATEHRAQRLAPQSGDPDPIRRRPAERRHRRQCRGRGHCLLGGLHAPGVPGVHVEEGRGRSTAPATAPSTIPRTRRRSLTGRRRGASPCCRSGSRTASWWRPGRSPAASAPRR